MWRYGVLIENNDKDIREASADYFTDKSFVKYSLQQVCALTQSFDKSLFTERMIKRLDQND